MNLAFRLLHVKMLLSTLPAQDCALLANEYGGWIGLADAYDHRNDTAPYPIVDAQQALQQI